MPIESILSLATALGTWAAVACALIAVWRQNRNAARLMCLQLSLQMATHYDSETMQIARSRLASRLLQDPKSISFDDSIPVFFENVAHLARRGLLDKELVWNVFSLDAPYYWTAIKDQVANLRTELNDASMFEEFENWVQDLVKPQESPLSTALPSLGITDESVQAFLLRKVCTTRRDVPFEVS